MKKSLKCTLHTEGGGEGNNRVKERGREAQLVAARGPSVHHSISSHTHTHTLSLSVTLILRHARAHTWCTYSSLSSPLHFRPLLSSVPDSRDPVRRPVILTVRRTVANVSAARPRDVTIYVTTPLCEFVVKTQNKCPQSLDMAHHSKHTNRCNVISFPITEFPRYVGTICGYTLPFKSLGSLRNDFIFQRKALFFQ